MKGNKLGMLRRTSLAIACSVALSVSFVNSVAAAATAVSGTLPSPTYATGSVQLALFSQLNQDRTECGFPALQENTLLDKAAQNHAAYNVANEGRARTPRSWASRISRV